MCPASARAITEAVAIRRDLAANHPVFLPDFAGSLVAYGIRLTELGHFDAALSADREAVSVYLALAAIDPERYQGALEHAVGNLVVDLRDLGRTEQDIAAELNGLPLTDAD